jgi:hypothetical protein
MSLICFVMLPGIQPAVTCSTCARRNDLKITPRQGFCKPRSLRGNAKGIREMHLESKRLRSAETKMVIEPQIVDQRRDWTTNP